MPIMGRKPVPEEEPKSITNERSNGKFTMRWIKELTQKSFSLSIKLDNKGGETVKTSKGKKKKYGWSRITTTQTLLTDQEEIENGNFSYKQIKAAAQDFRPANKIGEGGFGSVYKGVLHDGRAIAVKVLSPNSMQGKKEFLNEINAMSAYRHPNIVTLFGHCVAADNKFILVYEYLANGSLDNALFGNKNLKKRLNWETRVKICIGIAKGLVFLHDGAEMKVVHRDIKLTNVLLDKHLTAKIADFGLAKQLNVEQETHTVVGTMGYGAPEYVMQGYLTEKADVYSFGVLVLELMSGRHWSGRRCLDSSKDSQRLLKFAKVLKNKGDLISLLDQDLINVPENEATMVLDLAMLCISYSPKERPNMSDVVQILEGKNVALLNTPSVPLKSEDGITSVEMALSGFSCNDYLDSTTKETVTGQGNASTTLADDQICYLESPAKDDKSGEEEDEVGIQYFPYVSFVEVCNTKTTEVVCNCNANAKELKHEVDGDEIQIRSFHSSSNSTSLSSRAMASIGEGTDYSRLSMICTSVPISETLVSSAKVSSTSTTLEEEAELEYIEPHFEQGKYHIEFSNEEFKVGCNKWKNCLVGYLLSENGMFDIDKEVDKAVLREMIPSRNGYSVFSMGNGHYLFQFSCVEDKVRGLESSGLLCAKGKRLVLMKWDWKLKFDKDETMKTIRLWVKIYNLPLFLWNPSCLGKVVSVFGIPICADQKTIKQQQLDYARVYIKIDARKPLPDSFLISVKGVDYLLKLEYDWKPLRCTRCFTFGHIESGCKLKIKVKQD